MRSVFQIGQTWVEVKREGLRISVSYRPAVRRAGLRFEVLDLHGAVVDTYHVCDATPSDDMVLIADFETEDASERAEWLASHLQHGILALDEHDLFDSISIAPLAGGLYESGGVRGVLGRDGDGWYLETAQQTIPLTGTELDGLAPVSSGVAFISAENAP